MLCAPNRIGVFQVESRAQMNMLPRLKPRKFYDLVIEVAIVRPGPIQGDMVHPYLRRREGIEKDRNPFTRPRLADKNELYKCPRTDPGCSAVSGTGDADRDRGREIYRREASKLRRSMATFAARDRLNSSGNALSKGCANAVIREKFVENCFKQIEGFGDYGFPESQPPALRFSSTPPPGSNAITPIVPCALLNSQPMGFYATVTACV